MKYLEEGINVVLIHERLLFDMNKLIGDHKSIDIKDIINDTSEQIKEFLSGTKDRIIFITNIDNLKYKTLATYIQYKDFLENLLHFNIDYHKIFIFLDRSTTADIRIVGDYTNISSSYPMSLIYLTRTLFVVTSEDKMRIQKSLYYEFNTEIDIKDFYDEESL